jgi:cytochrome c oxidase subunit 3
MVLSIAKLVRGERRGAVVFLGGTILLGLSFLVVKIFEWKDKIGHGLFPGSEELMEHTAGENMFYGLYFGMTGLHALHVVIGLGVLAVMLHRIARKPRQTVRLPAPGDVDLALATADGRPLWNGHVDDDVDGLEVTLTFSKNDELLEKEVTKLENAGLYWHLVDVIWIFLFPFLYLIT